MKTILIQAIVEALRTIKTPRFFRSERGYQGRFYCALQNALDERRVLRDGPILEIEYQKARRHQMSQRPDIILHVPAEESRARPEENNYVVIALKRQASQFDALDDFRKLDEMCLHLRYPLAVFINVDSDKHHLERYTGPFPERLHAFAVRLDDVAPRIRHAWRENNYIRDMEE